MTEFFMLHNGRHHQVDDGLWLHYPDTCNVQDVGEVSTAHAVWAHRSTALKETRLGDY
jgi:hypothetical protein